MSNIATVLQVVVFDSFLFGWYTIKHDMNEQPIEFWHIEG